MIKKQDCIVARCHVCGEVDGWMRGGTCISELMFVSEMEKRTCPCCNERTIYTVRKNCRIKKNGEPYARDMNKYVPDEPKPSMRTIAIMIERFNAMTRAVARPV